MNLEQPHGGNKILECQEKDNIEIRGEKFKQGDLVYVVMRIKPRKAVLLDITITSTYTVGYIEKLCWEWNYLESRYENNLYLNCFSNKKAVSMINYFTILDIKKISKRKAKSYLA